MHRNTTWNSMHMLRTRMINGSASGQQLPSLALHLHKSSCTNFLKCKSSAQWCENEFMMVATWFSNMILWWWHWIYDGFSSNKILNTMHQSFNRVLKRIQTEALKQINNSKKKRQKSRELKSSYERPSLHETLTPNFCPQRSSNGEEEHSPRCFSM